MANAGKKNAPGGNPQDPCPGCSRFPATMALKRLAGFWKTPILCLLLERPRRFAELERELAPISAKVLTQRLKELERAGYCTRVELVSMPPKVVEYRLTPLGAATGPALEALAVWGRAAAAAEAASGRSVVGRGTRQSAAAAPG